MKFLASLDPRDRRLLLWSIGIAVTLAAGIGIFLPNSNSDDNPLPSSYLAGQHGARAAFETLLNASYSIERWERPLTELAANAGPATVVIFAEPFSREADDIKAIRQIVERGGRVVSTGYWGGYILPNGQPDTPKNSILPHANSNLKDSIRSLIPAKCGWFHKPLGRSATPTNARNIAAQANPR